MILIFERGLSLTLKRKLIEIFDMIPVFEKALRLALQKKLHETLQIILVFELSNSEITYSYMVISMNTAKYLGTTTPGADVIKKL